MASKLGDRLKALMEEKGVSTAQLAQAGGIDESTMQGILRGDIERPPDRRLRGFAERLGVSFESLLQLIPEERREEASFDRAECRIELIAAGAPEWVQLLPLGEVRPRDGRETWRVEDAAALVATSLAGVDGLLIDYDHQTEFTRQSGNTAKAAAWMREIAVRDDGIWARVEWTEAGRAAVAAKEYRFISPVFLFDKETRAITRILRAGLTNDPALTLKALAKREADNPEETMKELLEKLRKILGLAEDADQAAVCAAIEKAVDGAKGKDDGETKALASVAKALGLSEDAKAEEIETAAASATAKAAQAGKGGDALARLAKLEEQRATEKAEASVDAAVKAGKLTPAQRDWALGYAAKDPEAFAAFVEKQPVIAAGAGLPPGDPPKGGEGLTADELAYCRSRGIKVEDFKASKENIRARDEEAA